MNPVVEQRLRDALGAAQLIERATQHQTRDGYLLDEWFQSAAERQLEIIGEAFTQAVKLDSSIAEAIPEFRGWIGLRNVLAHAYQDLKPAILWDTIVQEIPQLAVTLASLLDSIDRGDSPPPEGDT